MFVRSIDANAGENVPKIPPLFPSPRPKPDIANMV